MTLTEHRLTVTPREGDEKEERQTYGHEKLRTHLDRNQNSGYINQIRTISLSPKAPSGNKEKINIFLKNQFLSLKYLELLFTFYCY